jgi:hypothetical protein
VHEFAFCKSTVGNKFFDSLTYDQRVLLKDRYVRAIQGPKRMSLLKRLKEMFFERKTSKEVEGSQA